MLSETRRPARRAESSDRPAVLPAGGALALVEEDSERGDPAREGRHGQGRAGAPVTSQSDGSHGAKEIVEAAGKGDAERPGTRP